MSRKAFTMIELLFVIVIMGIVGGLALEAIRQYYEGVYKTQTIAKRVSEADHILDLVAKRFENAIELSIANFDGSGDDSITGACDGHPVADGNNTDFTVVMVTVETDSQRVQYGDEPGWYEEIDKNSTATKMNSSGVNHNRANDIINQKYGYGLVNSAIYNAQGFTDVCRDFYPSSADDDAGVYYVIDSFTKTDVVVSSKANADLDVYGSYIQKYLLDTGIAFRAMDDGRFVMFSGFRPWLGHNYKNSGKETLLGTNVSSFHASFDKDNNMINTGAAWKLKICMMGLDEGLATADDQDLAICRERSVNVRY